MEGFFSGRTAIFLFNLPVLHKQDRAVCRFVTFCMSVEFMSEVRSSIAAHCHVWRCVGSGLEVKRGRER